MRQKTSTTPVRLPAGPAKYLSLFDVDEHGALRPISRQEALDRNLIVYTGRPSTFDLPVKLQGGGFAAIRYTVNGLTPGQLHNQRQPKQHQENQS